MDNHTDSEKVEAEQKIQEKRTIPGSQGTPAVQNEKSADVGQDGKSARAGQAGQDEPYWNEFQKAASEKLSKERSGQSEYEGSSVKITLREYRNLSKDIKSVRKEMADEGKELPSKNAFRREAIRRMFSIRADSASHEEIRDRLIAGGHVSGTNMVVMVCAILIASVGLNTNSTAVIIGAMLISPLMGSILAMSYGTASADYQIVGRHAIGFAFQIIFSVITSTVYFLLSPDKAPTSELLARTSPSFFDVIIACAGGVSGIIGQTRKDKSNNIIPGVAIATALMPPLCTCGYSIANGRWRMLSGAAYLFLLNAYFIYLSACIVLSILQIPHVVEVPENVWKKKKRKMIRNTVLVTLPTILVMVHFNYTA